jgi:DNA (cytosine-5)-methyltransferase 1
VTLAIGSLFAGFGGLDMAVEEAFGARTAWVSEIDPGACKVLAHRFPDAPNLGDITAIDWATVPRVDIITGGSPCQDLSTAGRRAGMTDGTRSNLWVAMREAIAQLQPRFVVWENVRGALSAHADSDLEPCPGCVGDERDEPALRALGRVLGDLADLGFDAEWEGLRAADVGAPHARFRVFVLAAHPERVARLERRLTAAGQTPPWRALSTTPRRDRAPMTLLPTPTATPYGSNRSASDGATVRPSLAGLAQEGHLSRFGKYAPAIARWEQIVGPAPAPTKPGRTGKPRLNPEFASWLMGLPPGWITDTPGLTDNQALHAAGNGCVPQQVAAALEICLRRMYPPLGRIE